MSRRNFPGPPDLPLRFDIEETPQVWNIHSFMIGAVPGPSMPWRVRYLGISDERGRLMVLICHNTDLGDGWERVGVDEDYTREMSLKAFPMGINAIVYALTQASQGRAPGN